MNALELIQLAIKALEGSEKGDADVAVALADKGVPIEHARSAVIFTTLAFGRFALTNAGPEFDRRYQVGDDMHLLAEHPLFVEALAAARTVERETFQQIAFRSSEIAAINSAAHAGSNLDDLTLSPPLLAPEWVGGRELESSSQVELTAESAIARARVRELFEGHGSKTIDCDARIYSGVVRSSALSIQLDVMAKHPRLGERVVLESTGGIGKGIDEAIADVIKRFASGSLHPMLAALEDETLGGDQIETEDLVGWRAVMGPLLHQMKVPTTLAYADLLDSLLEAFCQSDPTREPHWLRIYTMRGPDGAMGLDVLVDNESWKPGVELVSNWDWPWEGETYAVRHFLFLLPID